MKKKHKETTFKVGNEKLTNSTTHFNEYFLFIYLFIYLEYNASTIQLQSCYNLTLNTLHYLQYITYSTIIQYILLLTI